MQRPFPLTGLALAALAVLAAACASSGGRRADPAACAAQPIDSAFLRGGAVFRECEVDRRAKRTSETARISPEFRPLEMRSACYSATFEFVVDSAGVPESGTARLVRSTDTQYAREVQAVLPRWRYMPALKDGVPVRQVVRDGAMMATNVRRVVVSGGGGPPPPSQPTANEVPSVPRC